MFYKPNYCANCSEKIERLDWRPWTSRRFCQLCQTDFTLQEWAPRIIFGFSLIFGIVGLAVYFQKPEKPLKISEIRQTENLPQMKNNLPDQQSAGQNIVNSNVLIPGQIAVKSSDQARRLTANQQSLTQNAQPKASENQQSVADSVYFCGAETKKGTPCSRRVKGGGRCWQHAGQPAILPPHKLIASQ
jgi:hypothetical protein